MKVWIFYALYYYKLIKHLIFRTVSVRYRIVVRCVVTFDHPTVYEINIRDHMSTMWLLLYVYICIIEGLPILYWKESLVTNVNITLSNTVDCMHHPMPWSDPNDLTHNFNHTPDFKITHSIPWLSSKQHTYTHTKSTNTITHFYVQCKTKLVRITCRSGYQQEITTCYNYCVEDILFIYCYVYLFYTPVYLGFLSFQQILIYFNKIFIHNAKR